MLEMTGVMTPKLQVSWTRTGHRGSWCRRRRRRRVKSGAGMTGLPPGPGSEQFVAAASPRIWFSYRVYDLRVGRRPPGLRVVRRVVGGDPGHVLEVDVAEVDPAEVQRDDRQDQDHGQRERELHERLASGAGSAGGAADAGDAGDRWDAHGTVAADQSTAPSPDVLAPCLAMARARMAQPAPFVGAKKYRVRARAAIARGSPLRARSARRASGSSGSRSAWSPG